MLVPAQRSGMGVLSSFYWEVQPQRRISAALVGTHPSAINSPAGGGLTAH